MKSIVEMSLDDIDQFYSEDRPKNKANEGRAFLLPLLASHVTNTRLSHFTSHFLPLSEKLFDLKLKADADGKAQESKVWQVLTSQVWACFKGYCDLTVDLQEVGNSFCTARSF